MGIVAEETGTEGASEARSPRWRRLWTLAYSRLAATRPNGVVPLSVPAAAGAGSGRRLRVIGMACLGVVIVVVLAGATVGGFLGAAGVSLVRHLTTSEPLVSSSGPDSTAATR